MRLQNEPTNLLKNKQIVISIRSADGRLDIEATILDHLSRGSMPMDCKRAALGGACSARGTREEGL